MTGHPPSPLVAAVGLVAAAADGVRRLPHLLGTAGHAAVRRYDELAVRGQEVLAGHPPETGAPARGQGVLAGHPPETGAPARGQGVLAGHPPETGAPARGRGVLAGHPETGAPARGQDVAGAPARAQDVLAGDPYEAAAGVPETAPKPPIGRTEPVVLPDDVQEEVAQLAAGADLAHDELPLADFDHQTVPQLRGRLRTLGLAELVQLRDYEQAHAARVPVLTLLDNRIAKLLADTNQ
jgi:hypothetical protein